MSDVGTMEVEDAGRNPNKRTGPPARTAWVSGCLGNILAGVFIIVSLILCIVAVSGADPDNVSWTKITMTVGDTRFLRAGLLRFHVGDDATSVTEQDYSEDECETAYVTAWGGANADYEDSCRQCEGAAATTFALILAAIAVLLYGLFTLLTRCRLGGSSAYAAWYKQRTFLAISVSAVLTLAAWIIYIAACQQGIENVIDDAGFSKSEVEVDSGFAVTVAAFVILTVGALIVYQTEDNYSDNCCEPQAAVVGNDASGAVPVQAVMYPDGRVGFVRRA